MMAPSMGIINSKKPPGRMNSTMCKMAQEVAKAELCRSISAEAKLSQPI